MRAESGYQITQQERVVPENGEIVEQNRSRRIAERNKSARQIARLERILKNRIAGSRFSNMGSEQEIIDDLSSSMGPRLLLMSA